MSLKRTMISIVAVMCLFGMTGVAAAQVPNSLPPGRHVPPPPASPVGHPAYLPPGPCRCAASPDKLGGQHGLPPGPCRCPVAQGTPKLQY